MKISDRPRADLAFLSMIGPRRWIYESEHPERFILMPGYFDAGFKNLRPEDEISVLAFGDNPVAHLVLVVDEIGLGTERVKTSLLHRHERVST